MIIKVIIRDYFTQEQAYYNKSSFFDVALKQDCIERLPLMIRDFLKEVPAPTAGLALGVVAIGKLISPYNSYFEITCATISVVLIALVTAKALLCRKALAHDLYQPVQAAVFGTFFMTYMQLSTYLALISLPSARVLWFAAVIGQFVLMAWFTRERYLEFKLGDVFATWFVCYVGIIVGSVTSPAVDMITTGKALFWFGFVAYIVLLFLVTARHAKLSLTAGAAPTFCIYAAPMSLSLAGYLAVYSEPNITFVVVLELLAQILFVVVLTQLPKFLRGGFFPSFAAMTFPFVITATALTNTLSVLNEVGIALPFVCEVFFYIEAAFAGGMTVFVLFCFIRFFAQKIGALQIAKSTEKEGI